MGWDLFIYFACVAMAFWGIAAVFSVVNNVDSKGVRRVLPLTFSVAGSLVILAFVVYLWVLLERPPLRTMGETRLLYTVFMGVIGGLIYAKWRFKWLVPFSSLLCVVFTIINIVKPEIHSKELMPALQSIWFIPHVTVYMISYSVAGCACLLVLGKAKVEQIDILVRIAVGLLMFGMMSGSIWAKDAWGTYWNWDPKETWAAVTVILFLIFMHLRIFVKKDFKFIYIIIIFAFLCLQVCWWGVNYLPWAKTSVHVYGN
jgi:Cytochrome C assembly protein.